MKHFISRAILLMHCLLFSTLFTLADPPGPPPPGGDPTLGGTPVGAPIQDGLLILVGLGIGYGIYKFYEIRRERKEKEQQTV